ncbi:hypothetical protein HELRODRAFT_163117 [Helobdella robusta]|uniref:SARAH domain-containing protein n=1 Tax=Helobdella robusta TaxID=6412 RepID=T1ETP1_HELRO|nr:hypothetical protein HELRODRAFT_163117 [Helobdella robusta]ESN96087.1 hypothetical protein HELRODRAFT_163117 [Helobdella robusta]
MLKRPKSSDAYYRGSTSTPNSNNQAASNNKLVSAIISPCHRPSYHTPPLGHIRPDWMSLQDIPDECLDPSPEKPVAPISLAEADPEHLWDGNKKLFVQLLDDMDNIGDVAGVSEGSARRRKKARELFTDWLFSSNRKSSDNPPTPTPDVTNVHLRSKSNNFDPRRFSGDFTNFDVRIPVGVEPSIPRALPGRLERQTPSRRSCGGVLDRKNLYNKWRPSSIHLPNEDEADSGYHSGNSAVLGSICQLPSKGQMTLTLEDLRRRIDKFNTNNTHGLLMDMPSDRSTTFQGFIRVHMNLIRPISMRISKKPMTIYDTLTRKKQGCAKNKPFPDATAATTATTTTTAITTISNTRIEVIAALLSKFNISDSPRKFALYERICYPNNPRIQNLDFNKFVLQENDTGEIMWEAFSLPELESFLNVLDKEEKECINQVREKYRTTKSHMQKRLDELGKLGSGRGPGMGGDGRNKGGSSGSSAGNKKRVAIFV